MIKQPAIQPPTFLFYTLGCKLNFAESAGLGKQMQQAGYQAVKAGQEPDVCVINTCTVTQTAEQKCRQNIHRLIRKHPEAFIVVTGCYAQLRAKDLAAIPGVDLVLGSDQKMDMLQHLQSRKLEKAAVFTGPNSEIHRFFPACARGDRTRYFLKVQDGCDYFCTYCTIPFARGRSRNLSIEDTVLQAREVAKEGGREIVLTGVNIGDFGKSSGEKLIDLLRALDQVEGIERYRISSLEPDLLSDEIIEFVASSKRFVPHFHLPLQAGSDEMLRLMHRRYLTGHFASRVSKIRQILPGAFIGVDVIVGMRGETQERFEETKAFLENLDFSQLHVFSYSERPGTQALKIEPVVSSSEQKNRSELLHALSENKRLQFYADHRGEQVVVLFEKGKKNNLIHGFTENYIRVEAPWRSEWENRSIRLILGDFNADHSALQVVLIP
ncbi:MAG: tRNA (N(6)-L-threonylcarbamoyladenosine(37)-C(2))-methylthiotransferase MtaB [Bacteroidales bacterium]|nr:tRNA (N(6)-L-threonylcarbamoyladenosine(37)-C(2))-methylthiotransferase MtaB [Bacteroidales bacterium]